MSPIRLKEAAVCSATLAVTCLLLAVALEIAVRQVVDTGMNFNLEMWKYARDLKQRSADPLIGHEHRALAHTFAMGVNLATNSAGHRDREVAVERQEGVGRIIMLGDSFILGWGVPSDQTVSARLTGMFRDAGMPVDVMNTGVGNYNTVMEVEAFLARDARFKPDMVVLNFDFNDAEPVPAYGSTGFLARNSEAYVFLASGFDGLERLSGNKHQWDDYYLGLYATPGWAAAKAAIHKLAEYCRAQQITLVIANWPELHDVQHYRLNKINDLIRDVAVSEKAPFVELLDAVRSEDSSKLWVTAPDPHPNAFTNKLYAEYLFPRLKALLTRQATSVALN
jgi:hypothetical protein